jgi:membrane protease YdiL (CAAX protease family)
LAGASESASDAGWEHLVFLFGFGTFFAALCLIHLFGSAIAAKPEEMRSFLLAFPHQIVTVLVIVAVAWRLAPHRALHQKLGLEKWRWFYPFEAVAVEFGIYPWIAIASVVVFFLLKKIGIAPPVPYITEFFSRCTPTSFAVMATSAVLVAPVMEELLFRRFMYESFSRSFGRIATILFTSFTFALIHFNLLHFLSLFLLGVVLQSLYLVHRSLFPCILLHALHNLLVVSMFAVIRFYPGLEGLLHDSMPN